MVPVLEPQGRQGGERSSHGCLIPIMPGARARRLPTLPDCVLQNWERGTRAGAPVPPPLLPPDRGLCSPAGLASSRGWTAIPSHLAVIKLKVYISAVSTKCLCGMLKCKEFVT